MPTEILVFYSCKNSKGMNDANGAFIPQAEAFQKVHAIPEANMIAVDCVGQPRPKRRELVKSVVSTWRAPIECVAFFGHGWPAGIQFGFDQSHIKQLASLLALRCAANLKIVIYACWAAENEVVDSNHINVGPGTDGSFADCLRDAITNFGITGWIDAHKTRGHATYNPFVVRFYCDAEAIGGSWLVAPGSELWGKWKNQLSDSDLKFKFPLMTETEIKSMLSLS